MDLDFFKGVKLDVKWEDLDTGELKQREFSYEGFVTTFHQTIVDKLMFGLAFKGDQAPVQKLFCLLVSLFDYNILDEFTIVLPQDYMLETKKQYSNCDLDLYTKTHKVTDTIDINYARQDI